jgi:hypothetical protein
MTPPHRVAVRGVLAALLGPLLLLYGPQAALGHEQRDVAGHSFVVGFADEPVFTGQKSGLEFFVTLSEQPVEGLEQTLQAEVIYQDQRRDLPLSPRFGEPGWYESIFFPTAAGPYTFRIFGDLAGQQIDEEFTSGPETFSEVEEQTSGQFPVELAPPAELSEDARRGAEAADQVLLALALGGAGLVAGVIGIGLALAARRRA